MCRPLLPLFSEGGTVGVLRVAFSGELVTETR